jgi:two-component system, chemotaxis family, chemotaxis protein CheY
MAIQMMDLSALKVLIADDNQNMQSILKYSLRALGIREILTAENGKKAYDIFKKSTPDIIITNWMMPDVNGLQLTKKIRMSPDKNNPHIPIIMLSAYSEHERITIARDAGITEFLTKPVSPRAIYLRLAEVILKPRQFVKISTYSGPDRRRLASNQYSNLQHRKTDSEPIASKSGGTM